MRAKESLVNNAFLEVCRLEALEHSHGGACAPNETQNDLQ
jgi:hypothetical protein